MKEIRVAAALLLLLALWLPAGCSDDDDPTTPPVDDTGPTVVSTSPAADAVGVTPDAEIVITFDEALASDSVDGEVTLSSGSVTGLTLTDATTLQIEHSSFDAGTEVMVTLGTGITDEAGNPLAEPFTLRFWTATTLVQLLNSEPADGAVDVPRSVSPRLLFSHEMELSSLTGATTASTTTKAPLSFGMSTDDGYLVTMHFNEDLPADTDVTIAISTAAQDVGGQNLAEAVSFTFTTGTEVDTTPPQLISLQPANGSTVPVGTSSIVMTFDEAVDPDAFDPSYLSGQLFWLVESAPSEPTWSVDGTRFTVPLATPLPAGVPLSARFDSFQDLAGNVNDQGLDYQITVAGQADWYPFIDGIRFGLRTHWVEYDPDLDETFENFGTDYEGLVQVGSDWRRLSYTDLSMTTAENWDVYRRTATSILFTGFHETDQGTAFDADIDPDVVWLYLPPSVRSWNGSSSITIPEGTATVTYQAEIVRMEDVPYTPSLPAKSGIQMPSLAWEDCWMWTLDYSMSMGATTFSTGVDSVWYAPGIGVVERRSHEEDSDGWWNQEEAYLDFILPPGTQPVLLRAQPDQR